MKRTLSIVACLFVFAYCFSQETELDRKNGFKDIKLASPIDSVKGAVFKKDLKEKGHHPVKLYTIENSNLETIGEVKVERIEVKTYKGLVYEILVITDKDERLMKGLEKTYGKANYNVRDESYNWGGKKALLKFKAHSRSQLELIYSSNTIFVMMKEDKSKKIEDISGDL